MYQKLMHNKSLRLIGGLLGGLLLSVAINVFIVPQGLYGGGAYGLCQVIRPDSLYRPQMRFAMYRWHITDPIYFEKDIRVTIQELGWRSGGRYLPLQDDVSCVAYFYLDKPSCKLPKLGTPDELEII